MGACVHGWLSICAAWCAFVDPGCAMQGWAFCDGDFPQLRHAQAHMTAPVLRGRLLRTATGARVCDDRETHGGRLKPAIN